MSPTQRDALMLACKVLDYAAEVADRPGLMRTCEEAADALRAALAEPPRREPLTEEKMAAVRREAIAKAPFMTTVECKRIVRIIERAHGIGGDE